MVSLGAEGLSPTSERMEAQGMTRVVSVEKVERRVSARQPLRGELPSVVLPEYPQRTRVPVHDISPLGLGLYLERPVKAGTLLSVEVYNNAGSYWHFKVVRVIHSTPLSNARWMVGTLFLTRFSREEFKGLQAAPNLSDETEFQS